MDPLKTRLEAPVIMSCNLSCEHCTALSPYYRHSHSNVYDLVEFERDVKKLSSLVHYGSFDLLGGEPLLLPNLDNYIRVLRKYEIAEWVQVVTNGLLLPTYKHKHIFNMIDTLIISYYPDMHTDAAVDDWLFANPLKCAVVKRRKPMFGERLSFTHIPFDTYGKCLDKLCNQLYRGKFHLCAESNFNKLLLHRNGITEDLDDGINIHECDGPVDFTRRVERLKASPLKNCKYCYGTSGKKLPHRQIKVEKIF